LDELPLSQHFTRVYFGDEFCQQRIPKNKELDVVVRHCVEHGKQLTLLTPYLTDDGSDRALKLISRAPHGTIALGFEIVVNDWGLMAEINSSYPQIPLSLGRPLNRQKRGPRIEQFNDRVTRTAIEYFKSLNISIPEYREFLKRSGVRRIELDNTLQGISADVRRCGFSGSLHYPYVYVSTTRLCLTAGCRSIAGRRNISIRSCEHECRNATFELNDPTIRPLILQGNTQYFVNTTIPPELMSLGVDRLVYTPPFY
jgi:hypothetical protein